MRFHFCLVIFFCIGWSTKAVLSSSTTIQHDNLKRLTTRRVFQPPIDYKGKYIRKTNNGAVVTRNRRSLVSCVRNERELHTAVQSAPSDLSILTTIDLCSERITLGKEVNLTRKNLAFRCKLNNATQKCILNGLGKTRHFNVMDSIASFESMIFAEGKTATEYFPPYLRDLYEGGSFLIFNSTINMIDSAFFGNKGIRGGAISSHLSSLDMVRCNMIQNVAFGNDYSRNFGYGGAIYSYSSTLTLTGSDDISQPTMFKENAASSYAGAIDSSYGSLITKKGYFVFRVNHVMSPVSTSLLKSA
jgi:hypothetical protein